MEAGSDEWDNIGGARKRLGTCTTGSESLHATGEALPNLKLGTLRNV